MIDPELKPPVPSSPSVPATATPRGPRWHHHGASPFGTDVGPPQEARETGGQGIRPGGSTAVFVGGSYHFQSCLLNVFSQPQATYHIF
jgi:hypothetical protein